MGSAALRGPFEGAPEGSRGLQRTGPARGESQAALGRPSESLILSEVALIMFLGPNRLIAELPAERVDELRAYYSEEGLFTPPK